MGDELSREQAQNGVNFDFEVKFDLEGQGQSPPKTIGILTKVFYTYGPNLVILAWTGDELSRGQTWWRTDGLTDGRTQATTIPEGQYWPRVKMQTLCINLSDTSAFLVSPLCLLWPTNGVHWAITVVTTLPAFSDHGNTWATMAMVLPSFCLLCATCCATTAALEGRHKGRGTRKAQGSRCSSYTETELSGFRRPLSVLTIFMVAQRWHEGRSPVLRGLYCRDATEQDWVYMMI